MIFRAKNSKQCLLITDQEADVVTHAVYKNSPI